MGYFDFLIDENNKKPNPNIEYIYRHDMVWLPNSLKAIKIKINTIVNNVVILDNGSYEFTVKETGEKYRCNYGWAFAENTPENIKKLKVLDKAKAKLKRQDKKVDKLINDVKTLK